MSYKDYKNSKKLLVGHEETLNKKMLLPTDGDHLITQTYAGLIGQSNIQHREEARVIVTYAPLNKIKGAGKVRLVRADSIQGLNFNDFATKIILEPQDRMWDLAKKNYVKYLQPLECVIAAPCDNRTNRSKLIICCGINLNPPLKIFIYIVLRNNP